MKKIAGKKALLYFYFLDLFLLLILVLSFIPFGKRKKIENIESSFISLDDIKELKKISISEVKGGQREIVNLYIDSELNFYYGSDSPSNNKLFWPCDKKNVDDLLNVFLKPRTFFVKARNVRYWDNLGVDEKNASSITFYGEGDKILSMLYFGFEDSLTKRISFRTWKEQIVYETEDDAEYYLQTSPSFWADPFLYPICITEYERNKAEKGLRRGLIEALIPREGLEPEKIIRKDFENGASIKLNLYLKDSEYIVIPEFIPGPAFTEKARKVLNKLNYRYSISLYTAQKLFEEE